MFTSAIDSIKWIIDTLRDKRKNDNLLNREKWDRVSKYLDEVAGILEIAASKLEKSGIPIWESAQLSEVAMNFGQIISQIYSNDSAEKNLVKNYRKQFPQEYDLKIKSISRYYRGVTFNSTVEIYYRSMIRALHLIDAGDAIILEGGGSSPSSEHCKEIVDDIRRVAGQFRGLAITLRASA